MIKSVQAGRAIAALAVFVGHLEMLMTKPKYGGSFLFDHWTLAGGLGVDFFFVLSGFIICLAHSKDVDKPTEFSRYSWRRFSRVHPIYWIYTVGFIVLSLWGIGETTFSLAPRDVFSYFTLIHFTNASAPLGVAWTLFYEVAFYIIFSILIINRKLGTVVMLVWLGLILSNVMTPYGDKRTFLGDLLSWMNLNFFLGMLVYWVYSKHKGSPLVSGVLGTLLLIFAVVMNRFGIFEQIPWARLAAGLSFAFLLHSAITFEKMGCLNVPAPLVFLGNASYTIYLSHVSLASLFLIIVSRSYLLSFISPYAVFALGVIIIPMVSCVAYMVLERPLLHFLNRHRGSRIRP